MTTILFCHNQANNLQKLCISPTEGLCSVGTAKPTIVNKPTYSIMLVLLVSGWQVSANRLKHLFTGLEAYMLAVGSFFTMICISVILYVPP